MQLCSKIFGNLYIGRIYLWCYHHLLHLLQGTLLYWLAIEKSSDTVIKEKKKLRNYRREIRFWIKAINMRPVDGNNNKLGRSTWRLNTNPLLTNQVTLAIYTIYFLKFVCNLLYLRYTFSLALNICNFIW